MVLTSVTKVEDIKVQSPIAVGSSSPTGTVAQSRKRANERTVARVPRKISRSEGVSVPTNLDPRLMSLGEFFRTYQQLFHLCNLYSFVNQCYESLSHILDCSLAWTFNRM